ncbi:hypothetical protein [Paraburkholderia sp. RL17-337-BIB-A]|uniref:hypothetical protein n=1 Tax=Paraburkholderia sp. RL17-337-BIB-A TaxID=3031636 RepID=UPI0038BD79E9
MSSLDELHAGAGYADNHDLYREMVAMEAVSTFAFQGQRWLADVSPDLLSRSLKVDIESGDRSGNTRTSAFHVRLAGCASDCRRSRASRERTHTRRGAGRH